MTTRTATAPSRGRRSARAAARERAARRRAVLRRRVVALMVVAGVVAAAIALISPLFGSAVRELTLPLSHEDIIRQQAKEKDLDPALIAGVIYAESRFRPRTSEAGAEGLMQILPSTAELIARRSGGTRFTKADLATAQVNIAYGSYYLRYLLDRYGGNEVLAIAAYNGGMGNVDRWIVDARRQGKVFRAADIRFPETRHYVERVLDARADYREHYKPELGL